VSYLWLRLSQTLVRAFGLSDFNKRTLIIHRDSRRRDHSAHLFHLASQKLMVALSEAFSMEYKFHDGREQLNFKKTDSLILDSSLVWHFGFEDVNLPREISIIDYACGSYSPTTSDLLYDPLGVGRALLQSYRLKSQLPRKCREFFDFALMHDEKSPRFIPWFWKSTQLQKDIFLHRSRVFLQNISANSSEIEDFFTAKSKLLFLPNSQKSFDLLLDHLLNEGGKNRSNLFSMLSDLGISKIFVKPHRMLSLKSSIGLKTNGVKIIFLSRPEHIAIPAELLYFGSSGTKVMSDYSSFLFSVHGSDLLRPLGATDRLRASVSGSGLYRLPLSRRLRKDDSFPWYLDPIF
jgi:hypothetical protein